MQIQGVAVAEAVVVEAVEDQVPTHLLIGARVIIVTRLLHLDFLVTDHLEVQTTVTPLRHLDFQATGHLEILIIHLIHHLIQDFRVTDHLEVPTIPHILHLIQDSRVTDHLEVPSILLTLRLIQGFQATVQVQEATITLPIHIRLQVATVLHIISRHMKIIIAHITLDIIISIHRHITLVLIQCMSTNIEIRTADMEIYLRD